MTDQADASSRRATHRRLCAHADEPGQGAHWLEPGQTCNRPRAADLLESEGLRQARVCLDQVGGAGAGAVTGPEHYLAAERPQEHGRALAAADESPILPRRRRGFSAGWPTSLRPSCTRRWPWPPRSA
jgi:hypothetical protein